jgi:hypothetical protein
MSDGPDYSERKNCAPWFRVDADFYGDDRIVEVGEAHGPAGPAVFLALMGAAKAQNDAGTVRFGWRSLARTCFLPNADTAQQVVGACEDAGLLIVKAITDRGFTAEIVKWDLYQRPAPLTNRERAQRHRDRKAAQPRNERNAGPLRAVTDVTDVTDANDNSRQKTKDNPSPPEQRVAPAVAKRNGLHPAFADVMALAQEAASKDSKLIVADTAVDQALRAYPHVDHLQAARLAVADILAGSVKQPYFHKVLSWKLKDQPPYAAAEIDHHADPHGLLERTARETAAARQARGATNTDREGTF